MKREKKMSSSGKSAQICPMRRSIHLKTCFEAPQKNTLSAHQPRRRLRVRAIRTKLVPLLPMLCAKPGGTFIISLI